MNPSAETRDDETPAPRTRRRWGRRIVLTLLVFVLLLVAGWWGAGRRADKGLAAEMAAYRAAGEPATVDELNRWDGLRSGDGENAVPLLRAAAAALDPGSAEWKAAGDALHAPPLDAEELAALDVVIEAGAEALSLLDEATTRGRIDWEIQLKSPVMVTAPMPTDLTEQRGLVNLARAAALAAHHRGDDAEALRRVGQMQFVGRAIGHRPGFVYRMVAIGCDVSAAMTASDLAPELRVGDQAGHASMKRVRELVTVLLDERDLNEAQRRAMVGERVLQLDFPAAVRRGNAGAGGPMGGFNLQIPGMGMLVRPLVADNARAMARHTTFQMKTVAANPDLPAYRAAMAATDPTPEVTKSPQRYAMASMMTTSLSRGAEIHYRHLAQRRLTATCLAIRLYAVDHGGTLPDALNELVPAYLPAVPLDPLAAGGATLRYVNEKADPKRPRVYSVGADGTDDGGVDPPEATTRRAKGPPSDEVRDLRRQPRRSTTMERVE